MKRTMTLSVMLWLISACHETGEESCEAGAPGCECLVGTCQPGLVCTDELCLYPSETESGEMAAESDAPGSEGPPTEGGPAILSLTTNRPWLISADAVQFLASVSDPDGIDDVAGGTLRILDGPEVGEFLPLDATGWQFNLAWGELNGLDPIDNDIVTFVATFVDRGGTTSSAEVDVLACASGRRACIATSDVDYYLCVDVMNHPEHCGECDHSCYSDYVCIGGSCEFSPYADDDVGDDGLALIPLQGSTASVDALADDVRRAFDLPYSCRSAK
jgi:hypothetical protein